MSPEEILRDNDLVVTSVRISLLDVFLKCDRLFTFQELMSKLGKGFDRVTLYRTLHSFKEIGIIHKISDQDGTVCYTLTRGRIKDHVHFKCMECKKMICLDTVAVPNLKLGREFDPVKYNFVVEGVCSKCRDKK